VAEPLPTGVETVGERLRRLRLERGLSQRDLSSPGVSYAYISRIEAGARRPSVKALRMLASKLGVTAEYLETGSEIGAAERRELRLADLELTLRLEGEAATTEIEEILAEAETRADAAAALRARIALGLAAAGQGRHLAAIEQFERALESRLISPASRPDVYLALAHAYSAAGSPSRAVELLEHALKRLSELAPKDTGTRIRFSTYLSYALTDLGELTRARAVVSEALFESERDADPYTRVRLYWSLGRIAIEHADSRGALESFRRAIALLEVTEDTLHLARAHMACAEAAMISGDHSEVAARHIHEAQRLLDRNAEADDLAVLRRLEALSAMYAGDYEQAEMLGEQALEFAVELPNEYGQAWWAIAETRARAGSPGADEAFERAVDTLHEHGTVRNYANVLRAYGRYLREHGREHEALDVFEREATFAARSNTSSASRSRPCSRR